MRVAIVSMIALCAGVSVLAGVSRSGAASSISQSSGVSHVAVPAPAARSKPATIQQHSHGVSSSSKIQISGIVFDPSTGRDVRYLSYVVNWKRDNVLLAQAHGLVPVVAQSSTPVETTLRGVDPGLALGAVAPQAATQGYRVVITPTGAWHAVDSSSLVTVDVVQTH